MVITSSSLERLPSIDILSISYYKSHWIPFVNENLYELISSCVVLKLPL